jgi:hypothetical protein
MVDCVIISGLEDGLTEEVCLVAFKAFQNLKLIRFINSVEIVFDDLEPGRKPWFSFLNQDAPVIWANSWDLSELNDSGQMDWELRELKHLNPSINVSSSAISRFIFHQLLVLRDLLDGTILLDKSTTNSFMESWSITVDGRLHQMGFPGYPAAECKRSFYRSYSAATSLLPEHWKIFRLLWEAEEVNSQFLKEASLLLPEL